MTRFVHRLSILVLYSDLLSTFKRRNAHPSFVQSTTWALDRKCVSQTCIDRLLLGRVVWFPYLTYQAEICRNKYSVSKVIFLSCSVFVFPSLVNHVVCRIIWTAFTYCFRSAILLRQARTYISAATDGDHYVAVRGRRWSTAQDIVEKGKPFSWKNWWKCRRRWQQMSPGVNLF